MAAGSDVGSPISVTDPESDTLTYLLYEYYTDSFGIDSGTGQISLKEDATLDYESFRTYYLHVVVLDGKDPYGNSDINVAIPGNFDNSRAVTINVTNVDEDGIVELSTDSPTVDEEITADLGEPDASISNLTGSGRSLIATLRPPGPKSPAPFRTHTRPRWTITASISG